MPAKQRNKYGAAHQKASRQHRARWAANPDTRCAICGLTLTEGIKRYGHTRAQWEADHPEGRTDIGYRPAHQTCNRSEGATRGNYQREPHTETW